MTAHTSVFSRWDWLQTSGLQNSEWICFCCLSHWVCGDLLQRPQETSADPNDPSRKRSSPDPSLPTAGLSELLLHLPHLGHFKFTLLFIVLIFCSLILSMLFRLSAHLFTAPSLLYWGKESLKTWAPSGSSLHFLISTMSYTWKRTAQGTVPGATCAHTHTPLCSTCWNFSLCISFASLMTLAKNALFLLFLLLSSFWSYEAPCLFSYWGIPSCSSLLYNSSHCASEDTLIFPPKDN